MSESRPSPSTLTTAPTPPERPQTQPGPRPGQPAMATLKQTGWLTMWQLRRQAQVLPLLIVVQAALAAGTVLGFGLLMGDISAPVALMLTTGAPTVTLIMVGLVMTPQMVAAAKTEGSNDWLRTLPVPRLSFLSADLAVWTIIAVPGMVLSLLVGSWRYHLSLAPTPWLPLAVVLISLTAAAVGYAFACLLSAQLAQLVSQLLVFIVLLFSPIFFPAANLPSWLATAHSYAPIEPAANVMRAGLDASAFSVSARDLIVLCLWCAAAVTAAGITLRRRA